MSREPFHDILYPTVDEIVAIHQDIINEDEDAESGILNDGQIEYVVEFIEHGHFGEVPETIHEKAVSLLRLLAANHPFADGNKRTALNTTWTFYVMNGYYFDYGEEIKAILKLFAVMERMVDEEEVVDYFEDITYDETHERVPTQLVRMTHLLHWDANLKERRKKATSRVVDDQADPQEYTKAVERTQENTELLEELIKFEQEYGDDLPEEVIDFIEEKKQDHLWMVSLQEKFLEAIRSDEKDAASVLQTRFEEEIYDTDSQVPERIDRLVEMTVGELEDAEFDEESAEEIERELEELRIDDIEYEE